MLYSLFELLQELDVPGAGVFKYVTFRAAMAAILSLYLSIIVGKRVIKVLKRQQIGEEIRDLGLEGQMEKKGTPTMGGVIIISSILIPVLLLARLSNPYIIIMLVTTIWLGVLGFADDYIKVFRKDKEGMHGRFKIVGQIGLGVIVAVSLYYINKGADIMTTIPFFKNNEFNYMWLTSWAGDYSNILGWIVFGLLVIFVVTAVSNGANLTDGLDGLAAGTTAPVAGTLAILAYVTGSVVWANYLDIMYVPRVEELAIYGAAFFGATVGFLWHNSHPAQVFMGDTGSLTIGGVVAVFAIIIHKELLLPILVGVYLVENLSVIIQVLYFKYTKKKYGEGRRIFLMSPLHHHYQKKGIAETKIVVRFWLIAILLAVVTLATLKIR